MSDWSPTNDVSYAIIMSECFERHAQVLMRTMSVDNFRLYRELTDRYARSGLDKSGMSQSNAMSTSGNVSVRCNQQSERAAAARLGLM